VLTSDDQMLLGPYATTPARIADEIVDALSLVAGVRAIALFGSLATRTHDGFSDIDMLVAHDGGPGVASACVAAIDEAKPVRYYRPFTGVEQPSGRYWFDGESPFHQLDVSFHAPVAYERVVAEGVRSGYPIRACEAWRDRRPGLPPPEPVAVRSPHAIRADEWERHGRFVYFLGHARHYLRGLSGRAEFDAAWAAFLDHTRGVRFDARTPAGRIGEMIQDCWQIHAAIDRVERGG
jgi:hypothetical protein